MRIRSPDRMISSCHTDAMVSSCHTLLNEEHESLMTQSLDPNMLCGTLNNKMSNSVISQCIEGMLKIALVSSCLTK